MPARSRIVLPGGRARRTGANALRAAAPVAAAPLPFPTLGYIPPALASVLALPEVPATLGPSTTFPTNISELNTQLAIPGARISMRDFVPEAGTAVLNANDVILAYVPGVHTPDLAIEIARDVHRCRITGVSGGSAVRSIAFRLPAYFDDELGQQVMDPALRATDIKITLMTAVNPLGAAAVAYGQRLQFDRCSLTGADYGLYLGAAGSVRNEDVVVNNSTVVGTNEASHRILQTDRAVCVSSVLGQSGVSTKHGWRIHQGTTLAYCARNTLSPGGIMLSDPAEPTDVGLGEFWFESNQVVYTLTNGVIITSDPYTRFTKGTIRNNTFTMTGATTFADIWSYGAVPGDWDLTGNTVVAP